MSLFTVLCSSGVYMMCSSQSGSIFFFQAEDGIRDLVRSRGLGDVYKRQLGWNYTIMVEVTLISAIGN